MIQIDDWTIITAILVIIIVFVISVVYKIKTSKLFPKTLDFHAEINPNEAKTISSIEGSGIIRKVEMNTTDNNQSLITLIVDKTTFVVIDSDSKNTIQGDKSNLFYKNLNVEMNPDKKFDKNFAIFFHNRSKNVTYLKGYITYEIKKSIKLH